VCFISGHLDLTEAEFKEHYAPKIMLAFRQGASFVVGDAPGCDLMAQRLLEHLGIEQDCIAVYHMLEFGPRNCGAGMPVVGGFASDEERDAAMTEASTEDIAWVRPGKRPNNGTQKNIHRRTESNKRKRIAERASWSREVVGENYDTDQLYIADTPSIEGGFTYANEKRIPLPPGFKRRYLEAAKAFADVQKELSELAKEHERLND